MRKLAIFILISLSLASCSHVFKDSIKKTAENDVSFSSARANIDRDTGAVFIWGGMIVNAVITDSSNYLEVAHTPLSKYDRIIDPTVSEGRYILYTPGGFDPEEYSRGRLISVAAFLIKGITVSIDGKDYTYPVMEAIKTRTWDKFEGVVPLAAFPSTAGEMVPRTIRVTQ